MSKNTKTALIIVVGLILTLLITTIGTTFIFMLGGQIVRGIIFGARVGPNDGELFYDGFLSLFAMPIVFVIGLWLTFHLVYRQREQEGKPDGLCNRCGYDLRGSTESKACPECGHAIDRVVSLPYITPDPMWYPMARVVYLTLAMSIIILNFINQAMILVEGSYSIFGLGYIMMPLFYLAPLILLLGAGLLFTPSGRRNGAIWSTLIVLGYTTFSGYLSF